MLEFCERRFVCTSKTTETQTKTNQPTEKTKTNNKQKNKQTKKPPKNKQNKQNKPTMAAVGCA